MSEKVPAQDYCLSIFDGTHETPKPVPNGYPLVTSKNIVGYKLDLSSTYNISHEDYDNICQRSKISQWDVLFSMIGSVGNVYLEKSPEVYYAIKNMGVFSCRDEHRAKWLYYYLQTPSAKQYILRYLNGAVQKFLPLGGLRIFPVLPFSSNSVKIISLLSTIDSKIELNNKINAELEAMARIIYDYWFVQFDFPCPREMAITQGRPELEGKPYKSSGGKMVWNAELKREIPEGWNVKKIINVLAVSLGGTPSTEEESFWKGGSIPWLNSGEVAEFPVVRSELKITEKAIQSSATEKLPRGTVLLSITRHLRPTILAIDACANQSVVGIKESETIKNSYIYPLIKNEIPRYMALRTGAQQPHINKDTVEETFIVIPDQCTLDDYHKTVKTLYLQIIRTAIESQQLASLRDFLLPLLMNGQITVA